MRRSSRELRPRSDGKEKEKSPTVPEKEADFGDWTHSTGDYIGIVKGKGQLLGILQNAKKGWTIKFGPASIGSNRSVNRIDMTGQDHSTNKDTPEGTVGCFIAAADAIKYELENNGTILIHCAAGNSRTGHALIVFLMRHEGFDANSAGEFVMTAQNKRGCPFNLNPKKSTETYFEWILRLENDVKNKGNSGEKKATYLTSQPGENSNKILHHIAGNKSRSRSPSPQRTSSSSSSSESEEDRRERQRSRNIPEREINALKRNRNAFVDWEGIDEI